MTRSTSVAAWQAMVDSGKLEGRIADVLRAVIEHGPGTSSEIFYRANIRGNINLHRARLTELQERDLIRETAQRKCEQTGRLALVWEYTGRAMPLHVPRRRGRAKAIKALAARMLETFAKSNSATLRNIGRLYAEEFKALGGRP